MRSILRRYINNKKSACRLVCLLQCFRVISDQPETAQDAVVQAEDDKMTLNIRTATETDLAPLVRLWTETTALMCEIAPPGFGESLREPVEPAQQEAHFIKDLHDPDAILLVAEIEGSVVGLATGAIEKYTDDLLTAPFLTIDGVVVDSAHRRKGIAAELVCELENRARSRGVRQADALVFEGNEPSRSLLRTFGYRPLETRVGKVLGDK